MCQQELHDIYAVGQFGFLTLHIVLPELHLKQVVSHGNTCPHGHIHVFVYVVQQGFDGGYGFHLFLQRNQLPEVLFGGFLHFVFRELQLKAAHILAQFSEFVAIHDLPACENRLDSRQTADGSVFHHAYADGIGQGHKSLGGEHLC